MNPKFIHLKVRSEFSLVDGIVRVKNLVNTAAELNMPAVALTDLHNMFGQVKFFKTALGAGVKPIVGADMWMENPEDPAAPFLVTLLAQNKQGYRNLTELISSGYTENQHHGKGQMLKQWLFEKNEGLIMLSGGRYGDIGQSLLIGKTQIAADMLLEYQQVFGDRLYLELQRTGRENDEVYVQEAVQLAAKFGVPVVATNDVRFLKQEEFEAHEARVCIGEGMALADPRRERKYSDQQYLKTEDEMVELFKDIPSALQNTVEIAKRCSLEIHLGEYFLPDFPIPDGLTENEFFRKISYEGLDWRLEKILDQQKLGLSDEEYAARKKEYYDRLEFELDIIIQMGFPGYFLIVMDFIQWSKDHDIPVGPGRGSGAGSLVAYALKITDLDPLEYDLLFERFLNPERVSMPDFDIDFCMDNRDQVISYVADNYGRDAVSQIVTFGTMAAKAVVRDVARVQGKSYGLADKMSKLIPSDPGTKLKDAWENVQELVDMVENDEEAAEIWEMACQLEGITRQTGKHAGGVVIAPTKLTDFSPTLCDEDGAGLVTQFDKNDVEDAGLVKFDFLGLRTLTIIDWALKTINKKQAEKGEPLVDIDRIPLDDEPSYDLLKSANTTAVFQLESRGMKDLIKRLQPDNIEDMIALVALFRPGPLQSGMVDDFINRKHGRAEVAYPHVDYQHEKLKPILEPTYGVIVYQEQVMQIAQELAGYTLGGADMLRRAMGKKKPEEMAKQRTTFEEGAASEGVDPKLAINIFDLVEKFAGYGFNKSHSAAYAIVSYQTLWLKTHYPAAFMAAVLTSDMQNTDKVVTFIEDCRQNEINVLPPDINEGEFGFTVNDNDDVIYGLGAIKGVGEGPIEAIVAARQDGPFKDMFDFCERVEKGKVNKRVLEALIKSGALDHIGPNRATLFNCIEAALKSADQASRNAEAGMFDMFGELEAEAETDPYQDHPTLHEWGLKQILAGEKDTLGLFISGHPFDEYEVEMRQLAKTPICDLQPKKDSQKLAGIIVNFRTMKNKRGDNMAFVSLDDRSGRIEVAIFSDVYEQAKECLEKDAVIIVEGEVSHDDYSGSLKMVARNVTDVTLARAQYAKGLMLKLQGQALSQEFSFQLKQRLNEVKVEEGCPILIEYKGQGAKAAIRLGPEWQVNPTDELVQHLKQSFGNDAVDIAY